MTPISPVSAASKPPPWPDFDDIATECLFTTEMEKTSCLFSRLFLQEEKCLSLNSQCPCQTFLLALESNEQSKVVIFTEYRLYAGMRIAARPHPRFLLQYKNDTTLNRMPFMVKKVLSCPTEADFDAALVAFHKDQQSCLPADPQPNQSTQPNQPNINLPQPATLVTNDDIHSSPPPKFKPVGLAPLTHDGDASSPPPCIKLQQDLAC